MRKRIPVSRTRRVDPLRKASAKFRQPGALGKVHHVPSGPAAPTDVLTTGEAAELLGVRSVNTVKRWAKTGTLDGYRRGGRVVVSRESVNRLLARRSLAEETRDTKPENGERRSAGPGSSRTRPKLIYLGDLLPRIIGDDEFPPESFTEAVDSLSSLESKVHVLERKPRIVDLGDTEPESYSVDEGI